MRLPEVGVLLVGEIVNQRPAVKYNSGGEVEGVKFSLFSGGGATEVKVLSADQSKIGYPQNGERVAWLVRYGAMDGSGIFCSFLGTVEPQHLDAVASAAGIGAPVSSK